MATSLELDDALVAAAKRLGGHRSKRDAVNQALADYVQRKKRKKLLDLVGKVEWDPSYDYEAERRKR